MIDTTISHYRILEKLGEGGMGVVYKAQDTKLERTVALKFLPPQMGGDEEEKQRFIQEAKAASALDHNNICTVYEINETPGDSGEPQLFIAMAYYEGQTLDAVLGPTASRAPLSLEDALDYASQISEGLSKAHEKEIVHRDLKPANVMITNDGVVKILDFGLAKLGGHSKLTKAGTTLGTTAYMSPEQARGEDVDRRTDIFSLGVLLYEMLTGKRPFQADYEQAVIYSIMNEDPEPITGLRSGIPMPLEDLVNKCLRKAPSARYQHVDDLLVDLKAVQESEKSGVSKVQPQTAAKVSNLRKVALPAIISVVAIIAMVGYLLVGRQPEITERVPIAVVDFVNETSEPELNGLSGLLITALEQSRRLDVMSRARMLDELKKMGREEVTFVDEATGRAMAKQANVSALAVATIRKLGETYGIDFKVIDPETGDHLFTAREEGKGQDSIFGMIDRLSEKTRIDLKEEENVVQMASQGIADVTTESLEAYQNYFDGMNLYHKSGYGAAQKKFEKAIALDSTFGLAYLQLANLVGWSGTVVVDERAMIKRAVALEDKIPAKEKYLLRALQARSGGWRGEDVQAAIAILKEMETHYPNDREMLFKIGDYALHTQQYDMAIEYLEKVLWLDPKDSNAYGHLGQSYRETKNYKMMLEVAERRLKNIEGDFSYLMLALSFAHLGDFQTGLVRLQQAIETFPDRSGLKRIKAFLYTSAEDFPGAEDELMPLVDKQESHESRLNGYFGLREVALYRGEYRKALVISDSLIAIYKDASNSAAIARRHLEKAQFYVFGWGNIELAKKEVRKAMTHQPQAPTVNYWLRLAQTYALLGEFKKAEDIIQKYFEDTGSGQIESIRCLIQIGKGDFATAKRLKETVAKSAWNLNLYRLLYPLAECQFDVGRFDEAANTLKQLQDFYSDRLTGLRPVYFPLSFHLFGKIYEKKGHKQLAIQNYEKFLDLWKEADPDLPDLIDAKARLARLRGMTEKNNL